MPINLLCCALDQGIRSGPNPLQSQSLSRLHYHSPCRSDHTVCGCAVYSVPQVPQLDDRRPFCSQSFTIHLICHEYSPTVTVMTVALQDLSESMLEANYLKNALNSWIVLTFAMVFVLVHCIVLKFLKWTLEVDIMQTRSSLSLICSLS